MDEIAFNGGEEMMRVDGFDDCCLGVVSRIGYQDLFCYDTLAIIQTLMTRDGMSEEEAEEYFDFNIIGAWVGGGTPVFLTMYPEEKA
jgi:hypothetical protein